MRKNITIIEEGLNDLFTLKSILEEKLIVNGLDVATYTKGKVIEYGLLNCVEKRGDFIKAISIEDKNVKISNAIGEENVEKFSALKSKLEEKFVIEVTDKGVIAYTINKTLELE